MEEMEKNVIACLDDVPLLQIKLWGVVFKLIWFLITNISAHALDIPIDLLTSFLLIHGCYPAWRWLGKIGNTMGITLFPHIWLQILKDHTKNRPDDNNIYWLYASNWKKNFFWKGPKIWLQLGLGLGIMQGCWIWLLTILCCFNSCFLKLTWKSLNQPFFSSPKGTYLNDKLPCSIHTFIEVLCTLKSDSNVARVCPAWFDSLDKLLNGCCVFCWPYDCFWKLKVSSSVERSPWCPSQAVLSLKDQICF